MMAPPPTANSGGPGSDPKDQAGFEKNFMNMFENLAKQLEELDDGEDEDDLDPNEPMNEETIK